MSTTPALQKPSVTGGFEATTIERRALRDDDILIDIAWAGICHTDLHHARNEWGTANYPIVPGHEIAGTVAAVGPGVTRYTVGDRVGVGCMIDSCGQCRWCTDGEEQFCEQWPLMTYNKPDPDGGMTKGGYSQQVVVTERFACRIPESIPLDQAAPLLCAGITTFAPLQRHGAGPGTRVAVIGIGGLGHLAVQIAKAMGAEVTSISRTSAKAGDARELGAAAHVATSDPGALDELAETFDLVLSTLAVDLPVDAYVRLLKPYGTFVSIGIPPSRLELDLGAVIRRSRVVAGSLFGGIAQTQEMLDFCGEHGIGAVVEHVDASDPSAVDAAYDRVEAGEARYRMVIDTSTITPS